MPSHFLLFQVSLYIESLRYDILYHIYTQLILAQIKPNEPIGICKSDPAEKDKKMFYLNDLGAN